jgi:outer membrane biosynthesis protein TonB
MKWLVTFLALTLVILGAKAEEVTTNNLITNGNFETGNSNGWTVTGDVQVLNDCCELNGVASNYDLEFGDSGSIEQDFNLSTNTITQNMLDNGITLDSSMDAQNGECSVAGCWGGQGDTDTFTNVLTIKDSDGNVLASNTTIRTDVTGINGAIFTDRLIYTGTGSNVGNINISGSDANAPANLGGPNIDNVSVTMTYDTSVLDDDIVDEIGEVFEDLEDVFEYIEFVEIEQMFEEMVTFFTEPPALEEMMPEELSFEPMLMMVEEMELEEEFFEEEIVMEIKEEVMGKEPMTTSMFASMPEEEIIEETNELISSFLPPPKEEPAMEEEMVEEEPAMEEEMVEEEPKTMAAAPKEKEKEEIVEEKQEEVIEESNEEEVKEEKPTSETPTKSAVQTKKIAKQKAIQQKKAIVKNLARVMEKVDKDIKNISKNLQIKNIIKMEAMTTDQVSLDSYNVAFYAPKDIYLDQLNLIDNRLIYADKSLATYIQNDKMEIKARKLMEINSRKQQLLIELEVLKNG